VSIRKVFLFNDKYNYVEGPKKSDAYLAVKLRKQSLQNYRVFLSTLYDVLGDQIKEDLRVFATLSKLTI
jgi:hypothetical protein